MSSENKFALLKTDDDNEYVIVDYINAKIIGHSRDLLVATKFTSGELLSFVSRRAVNCHKMGSYQGLMDGYEIVLVPGHFRVA